MAGRATQHYLRRLSRWAERLIAIYTLLLTLFTLLRSLRIDGLWLIDLANTFAPYWYMPLVLTFPLSIIVTRQPLGAHGQLDAWGVKSKRHGDPEPGQRARWIVLLQLLLIIISLYAFALPSRYKPVTPPGDDALTLITFNVQGSNRSLDAAADWLLAAGADIVVLQETAVGYDQRLRRLYEVYAYEEHIEGSARVFSRYPILERQVLSIEDAPGRLALRLLLDAGGRELALYALHLSLPRADREGDGIVPQLSLDFIFRYDEGRRNRQIRRLLELLEAETRPYVVAGDFNMSDASLIYDEIAARMNDAWRGAGAGAGRTWPLADAIGWPRVIQPLLRIDYIWHSDELRAASASVGDPIGSDHLPVTAALAWRGASS